MRQNLAQPATASWLAGPPVGPRSEDCLTANVWTGANQTDELRPVVVFIYGGALNLALQIIPHMMVPNLPGMVLSWSASTTVLGTLVSSRFRNSIAKVQTPKISVFRIRFWRCVGSSRILLLVIVLKLRLIRLDRCHRRNEKEWAVSPVKCGRPAQCFQRLLLSAVVATQSNPQS